MGIAKEQFDIIVSKREKDIKELEELKAELVSAEMLAYDKLNLINSKRSQIEEADRLLDGNSVIEVTSYDKIAPGIRFNATIFDDVDSFNNDYLLSDSLVEVEGCVVVTPASPIGRAVIGKTCHSNFEYETPSNGKFYGTINEIIKPKQKTIK